MSCRNSIRRLKVEALEDRRVCATNLGSGFDPGTVPIVTVPVNEFDGVLSASLQPIGVGKQFVVVDGSDNRDVVRVLSFVPGAVTIQMQMFVGDQLQTSETRTLRSSSFQTGGGVVVAVLGKGGNDEISNDTAAMVTMQGNDGNDALFAGTGGSVIQGGPGNDTIIGRGGVDMIWGDEGNDYIRGGAGNDNISGGSENDVIYGEQGNDTLTGDWGDDFVWGMDGNDQIDGGGGNDRLYGDQGGVSAGNDTLTGNMGDDLVFGDGGRDLLIGDQHGSSDFDGNDVLYGGLGDDSIFGSGGDDKMYGEAGNDLLDGEGGADRLYGGDGNDFLDGGYSDPDGRCDTLQGDRGADTFVRHHYLSFWNADYDIFLDSNSADGDSVHDSWHA